MSIGAKAVLAVASLLILGSQAALAEFPYYSPDVKPGRAMEGTHISVGTGSLMAPKPGTYVDHYDILIDGQVVGSSPKNPAEYPVTVSAGWGISVPTTQVQYAPIDLVVNGTPGTHAVTMVVYYSDGGKIQSQYASSLTIVDPSKWTNQPFNPQPNPVVNRIDRQPIGTVHWNKYIPGRSAM